MPKGDTRPDPELERELREFGRRLKAPAAPDLADKVRARLQEVERSPSSRRMRSLPAFPARRVVAAILVIVLLGGLALGVSPGARTAVAGWLGLRDVHITRVPSEPTPPPGPVGKDLRLGQRVTLEEARRRVPYRVLVPDLPALGEPDEVYLAEPPPAGRVALVYRASPDLPEAKETGVGLLMTQFRGDLPGYFSKMLGPRTRVETVKVGGTRGYWIEGASHLFLYRDAEGEVREEDVRLAGNTLLWERGGLTLRMESDLSKKEALRVAESLR